MREIVAGQSTEGKRGAVPRARDDSRDDIERARRMLQKHLDRPLTVGLLREEILLDRVVWWRGPPPLGRRSQAEQAVIEAMRMLTLARGGHGMTAADLRDLRAMLRLVYLEAHRLYASSALTGEIER